MANLEAYEKVVQNLKIVKAMKSAGQTDREIAERVGITVKELLEVIGSDNYLKEIYERAQEKVVAGIESKFIEVMEEKLGEGDTRDAKWYLERVSPKYQKKDNVMVSVKSIDEVIRNRGSLGVEEGDV